MSGPNPFDQFADDFRAAIPGAPPAASGEPVLTMGPPAPAQAPPKPTGPPMNAPPPMAMQGYGGPPQMGGSPPNMYGGLPPGISPMGGMGGPPPHGGGPPPMGNYVSPPPQMGGPPPLKNGMGGSARALVPAAQQSNPYANILGGPPPPQQQQAPWGQQPPPQQQNQWGRPPPASQQHSAPAPPQHPDVMDVWGAAPTGPTPPPLVVQNQAQQAPHANFDIFGGSGGVPPAPAAPFNVSPAMAPPFQQVPTPPHHQQQLLPPQQPPAGNGGFGGLFDPMGGGPPPAAPPAAGPWGATPHPPANVATTAMVPVASSDPFGGIFGSPNGVAPPTAPPSNNDDFFGDMGFGAPAVTVPKGKPDQQQDDTSTIGGGTISDMRNAVNANVHPDSDFYSSGPGATSSSTNPEQQLPKKSQLPEGGEYFDARIFTPTLGVMFFKPQELTDSLFLQTERETVDALEERPVVAFIVEGSSARSAGVELGNVLLKVNGIDVKNPKEASRLIKEGPRPLPLLFYVPNSTVIVAEGEHMVKYDTRETGAPLSAKDWKPKYVVIGGIIAQPWMMNMYRSKAEYDIAVIETQARRPVSVKVKQFSLQGARIQNDWQGPQMVKYKNKLHPWKFIVILPVSRNPIKISSSNLSQLKPVHEGTRRVLIAQQRGNSANVNGPTAAPVRTNNPYENGGDRRVTSEGGVGSVRRKNPY